ncbi:50S ribosomal protein L24 [uncultured Desulfovibrio sp.]|jgi:large subunit ribosomal protein L24|uniref:50S ribosomal protein L24 n=1 Tax=uncultured Desulfovibrio sp. TaxID=167968 RepID=UPI0026199D1D|nr:50S ribosomal protein L24 [uncultured Desulfovibrio sp.]
MKTYRIRKDDKVMVITGKDAGKIGKVLKILRKKDRVLVEQANMVKRHLRSNPYAQQPGGIVEKEMPIHVSNVMVVCSACGKATKVGYKYIESEGKQKKVRFCKKCNEVME